MKFLTVLEMLVEEIKSELDDIQSTVNHPKVPNDKAREVKEIISSIIFKLDVMVE